MLFKICEIFVGFQENSLSHVYINLSNQNKKINFALYLKNETKTI